MKKFLPLVLSLGVLVVLGTFMYQRLQPQQSLSSMAGPAVESIGQMPPATDSNKAYPVVNSRRLVQLAGKPYKGMSYKIENAQFQQMVAEQRQLTNRMPANDTKEKAPQKSKSRAKKAN